MGEERPSRGGVGHFRPAAPGLARPTATIAIPTAITAIHRAVAPMPAMSMPAPRSIIGTAIQRSKGFISNTSICSGQVIKIHGGPAVGRCPESFVTYPGTCGVNSALAVLPPGFSAEL